MRPLAPLLHRYDHVLLDLDGCVRVGAEATPGAADAIAALQAAGKGVAFVTNDPVLAPEEVVRQLWGLGVRASLREVVTVGGAIQHVCAEQPGWHTAYVIGHPTIHRHVQDAGLRVLNGTDLIARADVVVIAAYEGFHYGELRDALKAARAGAALLAAGRDATYPAADGERPGTGAVVAAVEYATGLEARSVGKPSPQLLRTALDRLGPGEALVVGDRLDSDVAGARACGLDAAIVLTGVTSREQAEDARRDGEVVAVADRLASLVLAEVAAA